MEILLNGKAVDALCCIVHDTKIKATGKAVCHKLKDIIPRCVPTVFMLIMLLCLY